MTHGLDKADFDRLVARVRGGDAGAALGLMRAVRSGELTLAEEARIVDAIYESRAAFRSRRLRFALALMCARTGSRWRARALLLELVAHDYAPAMHFLGCDLIEAGRAEAGIRLLRLARESGYHLGDAAFWRYQARLATGLRRPWLLLRALIARLPSRRKRGDYVTDRDIAFWLPE